MQRIACTAGEHAAQFIPWTKDTWIAPICALLVVSSLLPLRKTFDLYLRTSRHDEQKMVIQIAIMTMTAVSSKTNTN
jgi:hypothetical protein